MIILNCISIIILIIFEIALTSFVVIKVVQLNKTIRNLNNKLFFSADIIVASCLNIKNNVSKLNKFVSIITNKKLQQAHKILKFSIETINIYMLIKSLNFSKGIKHINYKYLKKIVLLLLAKKAIFKILKFSCR